jgi:hypothetical protein
LRGENTYCVEEQGRRYLGRRDERKINSGLIKRLMKKAGHNVTDNSICLGIRNILEKSKEGRTLGRLARRRMF